MLAKGLGYMLAMRFERTGPPEAALGRGVTDQPGGPATSATDAETAPAICPITVEIVDAGAFASRPDDWAALLARAPIANLAMHPTVAQCAAAAGSVVKVALAWRSGGGERRKLVGVWVLGVRPLFRWLPRPVLSSPANPNLILGVPVIDRDAIDETMSAMIDALAANRALPAILRTTEFAGEGPLIEALGRVLSKRGARITVLKRLARPKLEAGPDPGDYLKQALSAKRRGALRRCRRRLEELGAVEVTWHRAPGDVLDAFEEFLVLESSGWKGRAGSALARRDAVTSAFARGMITGLARDGLVTIIAIRLDGRPVAVGVTLRCRGFVHTWKCAYDETLRSLGPGFLMMEDLTHGLLADPSMEFADMSNNLDMADGLAAFWPERHEVLDLLFETRRTGLLGFPLVSAAVRLRRAFAAAMRRRSRQGDAGLRSAMTRALQNDPAEPGPRPLP